MDNKNCRPYPPMPGPCPRPPMPGPCPPSQYVGSRYVPVFADPIEWDNHRSYESLTIVTHDGESYTSKCNVGPGIDITNERYWAKTGAYNAQVEQYREEVKDLSSQVTGFAEDNKEFREKIDQYDKDNAEMKNTVAEDKARVDALAERVGTAESEIDGLQATTAQHTKDIADLTAKDADLQRQITSNDSDIAALQAKDVEQDSRLDAIEKVNKAQDASIAQNTADIAKNTKNIQDNAANIVINAHELADHAEQLKDHEARLTAQHDEITANHQAIEKNTSDILGLRSDLTEAEAKIESNRDAIAHIQEKDVQQDTRLDNLEKRATAGEDRLDALDTKTDQTNADLTAERERATAKETELAQSIAKNASELADHAEELADHEKRIGTLEADDAQAKKDISDIKTKDAQQDSEISAVRDSVAHVTESLGDYVTNATYTAGQAEQNTKITTAQETADAAEGKATANEATIGNWSTTFPNEGDTVAKVVKENRDGINMSMEAIADVSAALGDYFPLSRGETLEDWLAGWNELWPDNRVPYLIAPWWPVDSVANDVHIATLAPIFLLVNENTLTQHFRFEIPIPAVSYANPGHYYKYRTPEFIVTDVTTQTDVTVTQAVSVYAPDIPTRSSYCVADLTFPAGSHGLYVVHTANMYDTPFNSLDIQMISDPL